jgi:hypothetical protein
MRALSELGIRPRRRNPYPPATAGEVAEFERCFRLKLPAAYVELLQYSNGGRPTLSVFDDPNGGICGLESFYGLGPKHLDDEAAARGTWDLGNLWGEMRCWRNVLGEDGVPFGSDAGDNQLFLDLSGGAGIVRRFIAATRQTYEVAPAFENFIDKLRLPL